MSSISKLGPYINKLMTTVLDQNDDEFVSSLALDELRRLNVDINEFILNNTAESSDEAESKQKEKKLLQEDK